MCQYVANCNSLIAMPAGLSFPGGNLFQAAWLDCTALTTFPPNVFDTCNTANYQQAFQNCALTEVSCENILQSVLDSATLNGIFGGVLDIDGGTNYAITGSGQPVEAIAQDLVNNFGWSVNTN